MQILYTAVYSDRSHCGIVSSNVNIFDAFKYNRAIKEKKNYKRIKEIILIFKFPNSLVGVLIFVFNFHGGRVVLGVCRSESEPWSEPLTQQC